MGLEPSRILRLVMRRNLQLYGTTAVGTVERVRNLQNNEKIYFLNLQKKNNKRCKFKELCIEISLLFLLLFVIMKLRFLYSINLHIGALI